MEKGEWEVGEWREEKGGEEREGKAAMGVDPTKFGKKMMPVFIRLQYVTSNIKTIGNCQPLTTCEIANVI